MMNKTMMEDKLDGSSNFKFMEDKTSEENLLWVIQKKRVYQRQQLMNGRKMTTRQVSQPSTQALTLKGQLKNNKMTKGDTVTTFFRKISEDKDQPGSIGEIKSTPSGMYLYIYYLYACHEGNCRRKEPFVEVLDREGSQCIKRKNTLELKTLGLIIVIFIPLTYISKVCYITSKCCSCDNIP
jgi:hypothetical protein